MAFSLSGSTITQTGTDVDLSGLSGISGVTTLDYGYHTVYDLGSLRLVVNGVLSIAQDGTPEQLRYRGDTAHDNNDLVVNGALNIGTEQSNPLAYRYQDYVPAILETIDFNSLSFSATNGLGGDGQGQSGKRSSLWNKGTVNCYGRIVNIASFCYIIIDLLLTRIFVLLSTELGFRNNLNGALNCLSLSIS